MDSNNRTLAGEGLQPSDIATNRQVREIWWTILGLSPTAALVLVVSATPHTRFMTLGTNTTWRYKFHDIQLH